MSYHTEQRKKLYELLKAHPHQIYTVKEIERELENEKISQSAIYRNLSALVSENIVKKVTMGRGREAVYRYADSEACRQEIHLTCTVCGRVFHMDHAFTRLLEEHLEQAEGFQLDKVKTTLYGICPSCRNKQI